MIKYQLKYLFAFTILATFILNACTSQKEKAEVQKKTTQIIKSNHFKFVAQQANPLRAGLINSQIRNLDGRYSVKISKDTVNCYLPYFGVSQQAEYGSNDNGITFISTDFTINRTESNNGNYQITIIPKDNSKTRLLRLEVTSSGYASLNVTSNYRDAINFTGKIETY